MDSTQTSATAAQPLVFPTGTELYDQIMGPIEPELLSANIPHLDEKYTEESEGDRKKRYERYTNAYAKYDEQYAKWEADMKNKVHLYRKSAFRSAEAKSRKEEIVLLQKIEEDIVTALPDSSK